MFLGLYLFDFYTDNTFFHWGPPVKFFNKNITSHKQFNYLLLIIFFHQIINNIVSCVVYPWIINSVQDPKNIIMEYSNFTTLFLVNLFDIYSQFDVVIIVSGISSQISFIVIIIIANFITSTVINFFHLKNKDEQRKNNYLLNL
jgi:hypothetical protein